MYYITTYIHHYSTIQNTFSLPQRSSVLYLFILPSSLITGNQGSSYCLYSFTFSRLSCRWDHTVYDLFIRTKVIAKGNRHVTQMHKESVSFVKAHSQSVSAYALENELTEDENFTKISLDSIKDNFDYIFIDCPPSLGMLTVKALSVSDGVVIPMQCEFYSLEGMSQLFNTIKKIKQLYNPTLQIVGILLTMYNGRLTLTSQVVAELKKYYADKLFKVPISRTVRIAEAPGYGEPICYHDPYGKGSLEYAAVAKELLLRI